MRFSTKLATLVAVVGLITTAWSSGVGARPEMPTAEPRTLLETRGPIVGLAHDIGQIAWMAGDLDCLDAVRARRVSQARVATLEAFTDVCYAAQRSPAPIAVARQRVLWAAFDIGGNHGYGSVRVGGIGSKPVRVQTLLWDYVEHGEFLTEAAGDWHLVYATAEVTHTYDNDQDACDAATDCRYAVTGGGVFRVAGARRVAVPGAPPALMVAVSNRSVALVPANRTRTTRTARSALLPAINSSVEVRFTLNGALLSRFSPRGRVLDLALSDQFVAVLTSDGGRRVEIRDAWKGRLVRRVGVPARSTQLGISRSTVVIGTPTRLYVLDAHVGDAQPTASVTRPVGVSIEGRRIVWAENLSATRARVRALSLD